MIVDISFDYFESEIKSFDSFWFNFNIGIYSIAYEIFVKDYLYETFYEIS